MLLEFYLHKSLFFHVLGKVGMFGKVIKQVGGIVHVEADEDELEIPYKNLEPFMPDPGDKAKLLKKF